MEREQTVEPAEFLAVTPYFLDEVESAGVPVIAPLVLFIVSTEGSGGDMVKVSTVPVKLGVFVAIAVLSR
jgi:hypothetical protein